MIQPEPFNWFRFRRYARELSKAVQEISMPTIGEQLKAARADLAKAREEAATAGPEAAAAAKAVLAEVTKVRAETADLLAEIAEVTNGGPPIEEPHVTPMPATRPGAWD
jgi:hypothetical protein